MANILLDNIQTLIPAGLFVLGLVIKSPFQWKQTNNQVLDTVAKDYKIMKELYDAKCDEVIKKEEIITMQRETIAEARARVRSYENFLQARTFETDNLLKKIPYYFDAFASKLDIEVPNEGMRGHETAHSQVKSHDSSNS